ncbi:putative DNA modification/repair radical SAM protein [Sediminispirochaeta smaragdinae]|uniref:Radical SAM domain protein n=1 Tax=Sediminispirochaeta smaragdinae (strain DSM 11293 / JCM 15392 / SEBR 4228) TaxID=573413 RepID=E1RB67_SEDSS|nr:putative DNA modification/repair radical SAM protein [Sediminispirochaeta smaragdinae]ADK79597.1 Radical SAM domain protein [Sediminispirochaeta smaragdinae DSM 11293]
MNTEAKIKILADAAKYDVSCASSGSTRLGPKGGMGSTLSAGICHSWSSDGRCISLLKVLFSNACRYDCSYCVNRASAGGRRVSFTVDELTNIAMAFYRRNYIEGLFLSSGIFAEPDVVMEQLLRVAITLRSEHRFGGYIHMKAIPGASQELVAAAGRWVDRMSVNIELPSERSLNRLAPQKKRRDILGPMGWMRTEIDHYREGMEEFRHSSFLKTKPASFVPAGQSTQLIVGASPEADGTILSLADGLYKSYGMKRVYYSAFVPTVSRAEGPGLDLGTPNRLKAREHRLYQADWLMRFYGFAFDELVGDRSASLDPELDPKSHWAIVHRDHFPVDLERADYEVLLRVPGIGVRSAHRLVVARREGPLNFELVARLGVVLSRAKYFVTCGGRSLVSADYSEKVLRMRLGEGPDAFGQLSLFDAISGEL